MPFTKEQLDNWFTYHAPATNEQQEKYTVLTAEEAECARICDEAVVSTTDAQLRHDKINAATRALADKINELAVDSADKTASIRSLRLARQSFNEAVRESVKELADDAKADDDPTKTTPNLLPSYVLVTMGLEQLRYARHQANASIACEGK